jgi:competence protein ComEC
MVIAAMIFVITGTTGFKIRVVLIFSIAGVVILLGSWRFIADYQQNDFQQFYDQEVIASGIITEEPDVRSDKTFLTISRIAIEDRKLESKILLRMGRFPEYQYGQKINFQGKILEPATFEDFSYKDYLSRYGIDAVAYNPQILSAESGFGNPVRQKLVQVKQTFVRQMEILFPEPQNSFLAGILIGLRKTIPMDLTEALSITGTTHVIAISGFNITIIASVIDGLLLFFFSRRVSFVLALVAILLFVIMVGASASAVRAGIMGILGMLAMNVGRISSINNALALTAALMLLFNPQILHFDLGFLLSFTALMGLVYLGPIINEWFYRIPKSINFYLVPSIAAYIATLPILLIYFNRLSLVAIPVNVLILAAIPMAMLFGFLAVTFGFVSPFLAYPFIWLAVGTLSYVLLIVNWASKIPFAAISFSTSWFWGIVYYLILLTLIFIWKRRQNNFSNI